MITTDILIQSSAPQFGQYLVVHMKPAPGGKGTSASIHVSTGRFLVVEWCSLRLKDLAPGNRRHYMLALS